MSKRSSGDFVTDGSLAEHRTNMVPEFAGAEALVGSGGLGQAALGVQGETDIVALYDGYIDYVWRSLRRLGVSQDDLEDAAQDVFVVVHRRIETFEHRSTPKTWIFGIALRVAKAYRRRGSRQRARVAGDESVLVCTRGTPEEVRAQMQAAEQVQALLDELDDDKRAVFVLAELEHMAAPDIALALGIPTNTVYSRLRLARAAFEEGLKRLKAKDDWRYR
jgi:RNA polymerase sigma-70 factor, ECF subfamily